jgi:uncharacterized protein (TIGR04255 family)
MSDENPKYPIDTIQEALCEFRLRPSGEHSWSPKHAGEIFKALGTDTYPGMEPLTEIGLELAVGTGGQPQQRMIQGPPKFRFTRADEKQVVQVSSQLFVVNFLSPYPGWRTVKDEILAKWQLLEPLLRPEAIERVGLRYINRIPSGRDTRVADWLRDSPFIPGAINKVETGIKYRFEAGLGADDTIIVSIVRDLSESRNGDLLFDIDRVHFPHRLLALEEMGDLIHRLHGDVYGVFSEGKTEILEQYLQGKLKK